MNHRKEKLQIFLIIILFFVLLPILASANTEISGIISSDTTWSPDGGVYIINDGFSVSAGATLTILPGTIVKVKSFGYGLPTIYGKIFAHGTFSAPIYFTSFWDDTVGGDTDGMPGSSANRWPGLYFKSGSEGDFDFVDISDAGTGGYWGSGDYISIENDGGNVAIKHSNIHDNRMTVPDGGSGSMVIGNGIWNKSGTLAVSDSNVENNAVGIIAESGDVTVSGTIFKNNTGSGFSAGSGGRLTLINNTFSGNGKTGNIDISKTFIHSGNKSTDKTSRGFEMSGTVSNDTALGSADLPLIFGSIIIGPGKTLTLEPGTIIKMSNYYSYGSIDVWGNLIAKGIKESKIYFTSYKDDSVGGDTNGDGNNTAPAPQDWSSFTFESGSKVDFDNVVVRYGGYRNYSGWLPGISAAIYNLGAEFLMENSLLEHNYGDAIFQGTGSTTITSSEIINNTTNVQFRGGSMAISQSNLSSSTGMGVYNESGVDLGWGWETQPLQIIDAKNNWWGDPSGPHDISTTTPTGTGDSVSANVLYVPFLTSPPSDTPPPPPPQTPDPVIIIPGIMGSATHNGKLVIDPILHTYDDLIATLKANGYTEGKDLFTFPYEWRDSNMATANLLKDKINEVKSICGCSKVDLVAHSMGGLVAREYIESALYQNDVDQLIFLGTPHKGSPEAYLEWEAGEFTKDIPGFILKLKFDTEALEHGYTSLFSYIQSGLVQSVQELLPTFDYLKDKNMGVLRTYPNNYPRNVFIESLNTNTGIQKLLNSGVKIVNIVGNMGATSTIEKIRVGPGSNPLWVDGKPDGFDNKTGDEGLETGMGDGTVTTNRYILDNSIQNEVWNNVDHMGLPRETEARVFNILTGKIASTTIFLTPIEKILSIQLQSPVDMVVVAPNGKRMGKNFVTGDEYNEIQGAFYSGYQTGDEYITIPNPLDGDYKIEVQGTGSGKYTVLSSYISNATSTTAQFTGTTTPNQLNNLDLNLNNAHPEAITTDPNVVGDINMAYNLGWVKDTKTRDTLLFSAKLLINFKTQTTTIQKARREIIVKTINKLLARTMLAGLQLLLKAKSINQQAYDLLKSDLNWLINN